MRTNLWFFHVTARICSLGFLDLLGNRNLVLIQKSVDDGIPDCSRTQSIIIVHTRLVGHGEN